MTKELPPLPLRYDVVTRHNSHDGFYDVHVWCADDMRRYARSTLAAELAALRAELAALHAELDDTHKRMLAERAELAAAKAELELRRKSGSASDRLHNLCEGIAADADGSEWSREEWERIDAETVRLKNELAAVKRDAQALALAAVAYDKAIQACANSPDTMSSYCTAEGDDLDALYAQFIDAAREALKEQKA